MMDATARALVVQKALAWEGTPYKHMGFARGVAADCVMFLVSVFCLETKLVPFFDPRPYPRDWHLHRSEERYLEGLTRYAERVEEALPGDVVTYRFGRCVSHAGIVLDGEYLIHAWAKVGRVTRTERWDPALEGRLDGYWRVNAWAA